jgi:hypothetical protein
VSTWGYRQYYLHFVAPIHHLDTHSLSFRSQPQRKRQRRQQVSTDAFCVFPFWGRVRRPVVFAAWVGRCPVLVCWRGRRNHCCTKRAARAQPAAGQPTTRGKSRAASNRFPGPTHKERGETLQRAAAGVPRNGVPRQPSHTLHWNRRPKRSSGEAHSTRLSKPKHGPQKATDFGYRTVHEATDKAKPSFRLFHADRMRRA